MATATAMLDFDSVGRLMRPAVPADIPGFDGLRSCRQLEGVTPEALRNLARESTIKTVTRGATLVAEGGRLDAAVLIVRGRIRSVCRAATGREISVEIFRAGDLIADAVLAPELPRVNDYEAVEPATLLIIPRDALLGCMQACPDVALAIGADLVGRLHRSKQLATGLALSGVQDRVVSRLVEIGRQEGAPSPEGLLIRNRPTQQELANQIGACRETVSRTVSVLVRQGLLTPRGRSLLVSKKLVDAAP
jgi:CRP-like cAMP-binding protein